MMGFGMVFVGLFWIALIAGTAWIVSNLFQTGRENRLKPGGQTPDDILDQRYARGEISREQYEVMKNDLNTH